MLLIIFLVSTLILLCLSPKKATHYRVARPTKPATTVGKPKPEWVKKEIIRLKAILGKQAGCRRVAHTFNRLHGSRETVGKTYVATVIANHQYEIMYQRRKLKNQLPRWCAVNATWAIDLSFYTTENAVIQPFLGIIDHGSRKALTLQTLINRNSWTLLGHLCLAVGRYGKPNKLRTDNEIIFNSFVFRTFLKFVNIQQQKIPTASPWCNGRIERLFGTLKPMVKLFAITDKKELQCWLNQFKHWYNHHRPHQNLNGKTPEDVWRQR